MPHLQQRKNVLHPEWQQRSPLSSMILPNSWIHSTKTRSPGFARPSWGKKTIYRVRGSVRNLKMTHTNSSHDAHQVVKRLTSHQQNTHVKSLNGAHQHQVKRQMTHILYIYQLTSQIRFSSPKNQRCQRTDTNEIFP
jgi:hypothetical protein